mmetsp:Transcript_69592/g.201685  ORF Transcript_69592/g.201685 Transcript_69592/m.201685 type:complete len:285 (-) Transcript_69592:57-911(-)
MTAKAEDEAGQLRAAWYDEVAVHRARSQGRRDGDHIVFRACDERRARVHYGVGGPGQLHQVAHSHAIYRNLPICGRGDADVAEVADDVLRVNAADDELAGGVFAKEEAKHRLWQVPVFHQCLHQRRHAANRQRPEAEAQDAVETQLRVPSDRRSVVCRREGEVAEPHDANGEIVLAKVAFDLPLPIHRRKVAPLIGVGARCHGLEEAPGRGGSPASLQRYPEVRRARVEHHRQLLPWRADGDGSDVAHVHPVGQTNVLRTGRDKLIATHRCRNGFRRRNADGPR